MISLLRKMFRVGLLSLTTLTVFSFQEVSAKELSKAEITCLTKNAYHEAGNQGEKGILATVFVVLNRTKDSRFPSTPCKVISEPFQFSWRGKGKVVKDHKTYKEIEVLSYESVYYHELYLCVYQIQLLLLILQSLCKFCDLLQLYLFRTDRKSTRLNSSHL